MALDAAAQPQHALVFWLSDVLHLPKAANDLRLSVIDAPDRINSAYVELLEGYDFDPATILTAAATVDSATPHTGVITVRAIPFASMCAHHFLPFVGTVEVAYLPGTTIIGLGKIPRLVRARSRRFQLQEFLVRDLARDMVEAGGALAAKVTATAVHLCICNRGPNDATVETTCTYAIGEVSAA